MKVLFVTSEITYMPDNYLPLFKGLLDKCPDNIYSFCFLKNSDLKLSFKSLALVALGSKGIGKNLVKNIKDLKSKKREKLIQAHNKEYFYAYSANTFSFYQYVLDHKIDLIFNVRTRSIYNARILQAPKLGCLNIHHGILPTYRGTMCDLNAIADKRPAGFSVHKMTSKLDDGNIINKTIVSQANHPHNYTDYLSMSVEKEVLVIKQLLEQIQKSGMPEGEANKSKNVIYSTTPGLKAVREFKKKGIIV